MKMMTWQNLLPLLLGLVTGVLSAISLLQYQGLTTPSIAPDPDYALGGTSFYFVSLIKKRDEEQTRQGDSNGMQENEIEEWLGNVRSKGDEDTGRKKRENLLSEEVEEYREEAMGLDKDLMEIASLPEFDTYNDAQRLKDKMRVLCMVAVTEDNVAYITAIMNTWTNQCTRVMVVSNAPVNIKSHLLRTDLKPGRSHSWARTKVLLAEAHDRFIEEFDWFVKVPQDGFVVLENLRYLLLLHQANIPGYIGHVFKGPSGGGSVLVLSRFALEVVGPSLIVCAAGYFQGSDDEDVLETCFRNLDVISLMNGRDQAGAFRFQMKVPGLDLPGGATRRKQWNWRYTVHPDRQDSSCCQEHPISFHNVDINEMYVLEYAVHHLRPFGIGNYTCLSSGPRLG